LEVVKIIYFISEPFQVSIKKYILDWQESSFGFLGWNETQYIFYKISMTLFDIAKF